MSRFSPFASPLLFACLLLLSLQGCVNDIVGKRSGVQDRLKAYSGDQVYSFSPIGSRYNVDPPLAGDMAPDLGQEAAGVYDPFAKYSAQTYYGDDGTITRHYYLPPGRGVQIAGLLVGHIASLATVKPLDVGSIDDVFFKEKKWPESEVLVIADAISDTRPTAAATAIPGFSKYDHATGPVSDLMLIKTSSREELMQIDSFLTSLLTELPLIEIKVGVVEVAVSDEMQWGVDNTISRDTGSSKSFLKEWTNKYNTNTMSKILDPNNFQGSLFSAFGIHDKFILNATFELLQRITDAEVLSAPTITVLNGHRAIIETGDKVPVKKIVANASSAYFGFDYQQTGIKLIVVPYLLPDNIIEVHLNAEVVAVTGKQSFDTEVGSLSQPILSKRLASTRLQLREGQQAFALGGLMSTSEYEIVTKLPLLGDIPILGYLFKSKNIEKIQSQIIFYVEPRVVKREDSWKKTSEDEASAIW